MIGINNYNGKFKFHEGNTITTMGKLNSMMGIQ